MEPKIIPINHQSGNSFVNGNNTFQIRLADAFVTRNANGYINEFNLFTVSIR